MNAQDAIRSASDTSMMVVTSYLSDLDDADLMRRPGLGCQHLAWQLGHLVKGDCDLLGMLRPDLLPTLPEGFVERHSPENTADDDPSHFHTKQEYLDLLSTTRAAILTALDETTAEELDAPNPNEAFREWFPTVGSMYVVMATHPLMHAGQWVPVRRALGKPVVI